MKKLFPFIFLLALFCFADYLFNDVNQYNLIAQNSVWGRAVGGNGEDSAVAVEQATDGSFFIAGKTKSFGSESDAWVVKLDASGLIKWQKRYGGKKDDYASSIQCTRDGGLVMGGGTKSFGWGEEDAWVVKLDSLGKIKWQKVYGGRKNDSAFDVRQTKDGGYIVVGNTWTYGSGVAASAWVLKLNPNGNIVWQKAYKVGDFADYPRSIQETKDGGYIVAGSTFNIGIYNFPWEDAWIMKLDSAGKALWTKLLADIYNDSAESVAETKNGSYVIVGETNSSGMGGTDVWVAKISSKGSVVWQRTYGGTNDDSGSWIQELDKGGYIVAGETNSSGKGKMDAWFMKLNANGKILWQKTYGGSEDDSALSAKQMKDGRYAISGLTKSFGSGDSDFLVLQLTLTGMSCASITKKSNLVSKSLSFGVLSLNKTGNSTSAKSKLSSAKVALTKALNTHICD